MPSTGTSGGLTPIPSPLKGSNSSRATRSPSFLLDNVSSLQRERHILERAIRVVASRRTQIQSRIACPT
jgi:hypothetical protein